jgi:hypothetical protein
VATTQTVGSNSLGFECSISPVLALYQLLDGLPPGNDNMPLKRALDGGTKMHALKNDSFDSTTKTNGPSIEWPQSGPTFLYFYAGTKVTLYYSFWWGGVGGGGVGWGGGRSALHPSHIATVKSGHGSTVGR